MLAPLHAYSSDPLGLAFVVGALFGAVGVVTMQGAAYVLYRIASALR